jgi:hypothetical protein
MPLAKCYGVQIQVLQQPSHHRRVMLEVALPSNNRQPNLAFEQTQFCFRGLLMIPKIHDLAA